MKIAVMSATFKEPFHITEITDDRITLSNGCYIEATHDQDCCENNYADFKGLLDTSIMGVEHNTICFDDWEGGIRINGYAVNCYSVQNGYYSTEITFVLLDRWNRQIFSYEGDCEMDCD
jgi:hypothetical protein